MTTVTLESIRSCFEGFAPSVIATCDSAGTPNVAFLSQVHYIDADRVALSYQFFNKTRRNVLETGAASVAVVDPVTMAQYRLSLDYIETQTRGPIFESMKAKLAGIASHTGMQGVFRLLGADIYRVRAIERIPVETLHPSPPERNLLSETRRICAELSRCKDLDELCDRTLECLQRQLGISHSMILMLDGNEAQLYTVASRGYAISGIGSEVPLGAGVIGVAAREAVPIRIGHMTSEYSYGAAVRHQSQLAGMSWSGATQIPFPGLSDPESQVAVPIVQDGVAIGVLFAESREPLRFGYDEEDALAIISEHFSAIFARLREEEFPAETRPPLPTRAARGRKIVVRRYCADNSVFLGHDYLIKGVAGAIFWKLAREYVENGRTEFTNRELRLDPALRLPAYAENLEARLVLLRRRLAERNGDVRIESCGRGRFRLLVDCDLTLDEVPAARR